MLSKLRSRLVGPQFWLKQLMADRHNNPQRGIDFTPDLLPKKTAVVNIPAVRATRCSFIRQCWPWRSDRPEYLRDPASGSIIGKGKVAGTTRDGRPKVVSGPHHEEARKGIGHARAGDRTRMPVA